MVSAGEKQVLNLAVIGLGRWGPNHVRNFNDLPDCRVVAGADPVAANLKRVQSRYAIDGYSDFREAIRRKDVNAVVVCTPTATHYEVVKAALEAGKHVLCEKPLTANSAEAWTLAALAESRKACLMVGHIFLFNPGIEYLSQSIRDKIAGRLYYLNAIRTNLGPFRRDVNAAWDLASHDIYIFNHLLRERPVAVAATGARYLRSSVEDIVFLTLQYPDGVLGHIHVSWLDPKKVRQITLVGEKKMITWDEFGAPGPIVIHDRAVVRDPVYDTFGEFQLLTKEGDLLVPRIPSQEPMSGQARFFVDACRGKSHVPSKGSPREGAEVVDILEACSASLAQSGRMVEIRYGGT
jgi:predicted dehydrogenase